MSSEQNNNILEQNIINKLEKIAAIKDGQYWSVVFQCACDWTWSMSLDRTTLWHRDKRGYALEDLNKFANTVLIHLRDNQKSANYQKIYSLLCNAKLGIMNLKVYYKNDVDFCKGIDEILKITDKDPKKYNVNDQK